MVDAMAANATFHQMMPGGGRKPGQDRLYLAVGAGLSVMIAVLVSGGASGKNSFTVRRIFFSYFRTFCGLFLEDVNHLRNDGAHTFEFFNLEQLID